MEKPDNSKYIRTDIKHVTLGSLAQWLNDKVIINLWKT